MKSSQPILRLASVAFFNSTPLIYGLEQDRSIQLKKCVPSKLLDELVNDRADVALLPVIDFQQASGLRIIRATGICCRGPTLTVRLFSKTPIEQTDVLSADTDSHTSVVLAQIILQKRYNLRPKVVELEEITGDPETTYLLIGDKVITREPQGFEYQLDLGQAWFELTGLPFVFATWMARPDAVIGDLPDRLTRSLEEGLKHVDELVREHAVPKGWTETLARKYLTEYLQFKIGDQQINAIQLFHQYAGEMGLIDHPVKGLKFV